MAKPQAKVQIQAVTVSKMPKPTAIAYSPNGNRVLVLCDDESIWERKWVERPNSTKPNGWEWEKLCVFGVNE